MLRQAVQHIDHLAMIVYPENFDKYVEKFSKLLDITFEDSIVNNDAGVRAALAWEAGLELIAPIRQEGRFWKKLQRYGEGTTVLIFGVPDMDAAIARASSLGIQSREWRFERDTPWLRRFKLFREAKLEAFPDDDFAMEITLSQIVPRDESDAATARSEDCIVID